MPLTENCKDDVSIAKNYLKGVELEDMGRLVNAVLDMAERMAKRHIPMTMEDWENVYTSFLKLVEMQSFLMPARLQPNSPKNLLNPNLRNTVSFKTACLARISTVLMKVTTCCHLKLTLIMNSDYSK